MTLMFTSPGPYVILAWQFVSDEGAGLRLLTLLGSLTHVLNLLTYPLTDLGRLQ